MRFTFICWKALAEAVMISDLSKEVQMMCFFGNKQTGGNMDLRILFFFFFGLINISEGRTAGCTWGRLFCPGFLPSSLAVVTGDTEGAVQPLSAPPNPGCLLLDTKPPFPLKLWL